MPLESNGKKATQGCEDAYYGLSSSEFECSDSQRKRYYSKISRPLLDRIDLQIEVPRVNFKDIVSKFEAECSKEIKKRVIKGRKIHLKRFKGEKMFCNAHMGPKEVKRHCQIDEEGKELLEMAVNKLGFSARAYTRVLKVARTIADLSNEECISPVHISEAIQYRVMDKYF